MAILGLDATVTVGLASGLGYHLQNRAEGSRCFGLSRCSMIPYVGAMELLWQWAWVPKP